MICNLKLILSSKISMTTVSLAMSKTVLLLDKLNDSYKDYVKVTTLSANTKKTTLDCGELIVQIDIKDMKVKSEFSQQLENLLRTIREDYKVNIKKMMVEV